MDRVERPLSPHLQVYRPQITSVLSVLHRGTGLALSVGLPVFVYWLLSLASGPAVYAQAQGLLGSIWMKLCYAGWSFCFFYHLANGIRHLAWDLGYGFEKTQISMTGWIVVAFAAAATLLFAASAIF
jgi:succinate dehydrogenase / fumarate reductase cytochrome b subunit